MCMPRKLATMPREGVSFPSVDHLRVHRRPVEGSWKAYRGCLASEQAIAGGLMCMPKIFATTASLGSWVPQTLIIRLDRDLLH